jgi:hypothetical protein
MNINLHRNNFFCRARIFAVLCAGIFLVPMLHAQPAGETVQSRFLLIFDTSSDMKKRVNAVQKALNTMMATSMGGQLHSGDSIGVWTFDQDLHAGEFPLQSWNPDNAANIASDIAKFASRQRYAKGTRFGALQPLLNQIVANSERLTVLIFCDGEAEFSGTPFDDGINGIFQQKLDEQKKANQPFVIVLRSQLGQYVACTVGLPPVPVSLPEFPPLPPPPPPPATKVTNAPPPASAIVVPSLIIIGTNGANKMPPVTNPPVTNQPAPPSVPALQQTNAAVAPLTNPVSQTVAPTNAPASAPENFSAGGGKFLAIGAAVSAVAAALGIFAWRRSRRTGSSLITRSMNDRR